MVRIHTASVFMHHHIVFRNCNTLANSSAVKTLPLRFRNSIPSAMSNFESACKYLCSKIFLCKSLSSSLV